MTAPNEIDPDVGPAPGRAVEPTDRERFDPGFDEGGVPWYLLLIYIAFLTFFTWYTLEYQLPDFLEQGPGQTPAPASTAPR